MAEDISKKAILVILVIAIVLSITGTWLVLEGAERVWTQGYVVSSEGAGNVRLDIGGVAEGAALTSTASGNIHLKIG